MQFDIGVALTWILYLALFPMAFFWLRRAWRIGVKHDYSEVALRRGTPPPDARKWAPYELAINAIAGVAVVYVILAVLIVGLPYDTWTAIAGTTIWSKFIASFALGYHANTLGRGAKKR